MPRRVAAPAVAAPAVAALALAAVVATAPVPARAHQGDPAVVARIDAVEPPLPGVVVEVRTGVADQLLLVNDTARPVEVVGTDGAAFLRISRTRVEADVGSPDWHASLTPFATPRRPRAAPDWRTVAPIGSWGWFDHRLHESDRALTPEQRAARTPVRVADWSVPLRSGGRTHTVRGHVEVRPLLGAFRSRVTGAPDGATVDVLDGRVPGLHLRWRGPGSLLVKGIEGKPFARFGAAGVEVNARSVTWRDDRGLRGQPFEVSATREPRWLPQGGEPALTWLDRRLAYAPGVPPEAALRRAGPTTVVEWELPAEVDGRPVTISGETFWQPNAGAHDDRDGHTGHVAGGVAVALAVVAAAAFVVRRAKAGSASASNE